jgi:hypothetical protein
MEIKVSIFELHDPIKDLIVLNNNIKKLSIYTQKITQEKVEKKLYCNRPQF